MRDRRRTGLLERQLEPAPETTASVSEPPAKSIRGAQVRAVTAGALCEPGTAEGALDSHVGAARGGSPRKPADRRRLVSKTSAFSLDKAGGAIHHPLRFCAFP